MPITFMKKKLTSLAVLLVVMASGLTPLRAQSLIVSAAASLKEALQDINALYLQKNPAAKIDLNLAGSGALQQQIENGAPVDVFISAAARQMDALEKKSFILEGSRIDLLGNDVVLIGPPGSTRPADFSALNDPSVTHVAIGEPKSVPAGQYALEILAFYKLTGTVTPKLVYGKDVRMVQTYVETGNVDAGIVYRTDAVQSGKVAILATAPPESHTPVIYPVAIIKTSRQLDAAKSYIAFLQSAEARKIFETRGFLCLSSEPRG